MSSFKDVASKLPEREIAMQHANGVLRLIGLIMIALLVYGSPPAAQAQEGEDGCMEAGPCEVCAGVDEDGYLCVSINCPGEVRYICKKVS